MRAGGAPLCRLVLALSVRTLRPKFAVFCWSERPTSEIHGYSSAVVFSEISTDEVFTIRGAVAIVRGFSRFR